MEISHSAWSQNTILTTYLIENGMKKIDEFGVGNIFDSEDYVPILMTTITKDITCTVKRQ